MVQIGFLAGGQKKGKKDRRTDGQQPRVFDKPRINPSKHILIPTTTRAVPPLHPRVHFLCTHKENVRKEKRPSEPFRVHFSGGFSTRPFGFARMGLKHEKPDDP